jgi:hypothetical protein
MLILFFLAMSARFLSLTAQKLGAMLSEIFRGLNLAY